MILKRILTWPKNRIQIDFTIENNKVEAKISHQANVTINQTFEGDQNTISKIYEAIRENIKKLVKEIDGGLVDAFMVKDQAMVDGNYHQTESWVFRDKSELIHSYLGSTETTYRSKDFDLGSRTTFFRKAVAILLEDLFKLPVHNLPLAQAEFLSNRSQLAAHLLLKEISPNSRLMAEAQTSPHWQSFQVDPPLKNLNEIIAFNPNLSNRGMTQVEDFLNLRVRSAKRGFGIVITKKGESNTYRELAQKGDRNPYLVMSYQEIENQALVDLKAPENLKAPVEENNPKFLEVLERLSPGRVYWDLFAKGTLDDLGLA